MFIAYHCMAAIVGLGGIFAIQNHIIGEMNNRNRTEYKTGKFMKVIKVLQACSLFFMTFQGNQAYLDSRYSCISNNKPYFLTMIIALMLCYFSLMMMLLHLIALIIFCPQVARLWFPYLNAIQEDYPLTRHALSRQKFQNQPVTLCAICL